MTEWAHKEPPEKPHAVDPHYNGNGLPASWSCHTCGQPILLEGKAPPVTVPMERRTSDKRQTST